MTLDLDHIRHVVDHHGPVARVVVTQVKGSAPRDVGTAMIVWAAGQSGTIGGGALEYDAARLGRDVVRSRVDREKTYPLGPELGQCCGGSVSVRIDYFDHHRIASLQGMTFFARGAGAAPLWVTQLSAADRAIQMPALPKVQNGWCAEQISPAKQPLWIWGAGHVGRALVDVLHPLGQFDMTWTDVDIDRFPKTSLVPPTPAQAPVDLVRFAPQDAAHIIVTYSHVLDLNLCHALLARGARDIGLIGSKTKWIRFQKRLTQLGHSADEIARITCPIGDPALGKHPQAIAVGVAAALLKTAARRQSVQANMGRTA